MKINCLLMTILIVFSFTYSLYAQVTIGSDLPSNKGTLLDIKESDTESTKGLMLPRVKLNDKNNLYPMFTEGSTDYLGQNKTDEDLKHVGLIVYNQTDDLSKCLFPGAYVWEGDEWLAVSGKGVDNNCKIKRITCREQDSLALVALYNAAGGPDWTVKTNWLSDQPIDKWYGVFCENSTSECFGELRVTILNLMQNNLIGTISPEVGKLTDLRGFHLWNNSLSGEIPSVLGNLINLDAINLSGNQLTGTIPVELGKLVKLIYLALPANKLSGSIPSELANLARLEHLDLHNNELTGSIFPEMENMVALKYLFLQGNQLSGSIPPELGQLTELSHVDLRANRLSGSIVDNLLALPPASRIFCPQFQLDGTTFNNTPFTWNAGSWGEASQPGGGCP